MDAVVRHIGSVGGHLAAPAHDQPGRLRLAGQVAAPAHDQPGRLRLTRRGRTVLAVSAVLLALLTGFAGGRADAAPVRSEPTTVAVAVERGDSLWSLASDVARPGEDVREVVALIQRINGLNSASIDVGDVVRLPVR